MRSVAAAIAELTKDFCAKDSVSMLIWSCMMSVSEVFGSDSVIEEYRSRIASYTTFTTFVFVSTPSTGWITVTVSQSFTRWRLATFLYSSVCQSCTNEILMELLTLPAWLVMYVSAQARSCASVGFALMLCVASTTTTRSSCSSAYTTFSGSVTRPS